VGPKARDSWGPEMQHRGEGAVDGGSPGKLAAAVSGQPSSPLAHLESLSHYHH
jgi:hypothetical protein